MSSHIRKRRKHEENEDNESVVKEVKDEKEKEEISEEEESEDIEEDLDSDESEDNEDIDKEVDINFGAFQPNNNDFNGIKCLLSQLWLKEKIDVSELSQLLIDQNFICSVLTQEEGDTEESDSDSDEEDIYGITSVIPLADYSEKNCIKQMKSTLISHIENNNQIKALLSDSSENIGLIVNERFSNLPPKISLPSYQQLLNDLKTAKDNKNKLKLDFEWFLMVCKLLKTKTNSKKSNDSEIIYVNAEEEIFDELADHSFEYSVANQCDSDVFDWKDDQKLFEPFRKVLVLSNDNWLKAIDKLKDEFK